MAVGCPGGKTGSESAGVSVYMGLRRRRALGVGSHHNGRSPWQTGSGAVLEGELPEGAGQTVRCGMRRPGATALEVAVDRRRWSEDAFKLTGIAREEARPDDGLAHGMLCHTGRGG